MTRLLILIPADILDAVREAAAAAFGEVAHSAFVAAGSATGDAPATHWWLAGMFSDEELVKLPALQAAFPAARVESYTLATQPGRPWEVLAEMGLMPIKQDISPKV